MAEVTGPEMPPEEQSTTSTPRALSARASSIESSIRQTSPPTLSTDEMRKKSGLCVGHAARTASTTSSAKRMRAARSPP